MNTSTLTKPPADVADRVAGTVSHGLEAVGHGIQSVGDRAPGGSEHAPGVQTAVDWTRAQLPGVAPRRRRRCEARTWLAVLAVVAVIITVGCAVKARTSEPSADT